MADLFATAQQRAFVLASAGEHRTWPQLAAQLAKEGYSAKAISRIGRDRQAQRDLAERMLEAEKALEHDKPTARCKRLSPSLRVDGFMARRR